MTYKEFTSLIGNSQIINNEKTALTIVETEIKEALSNELKKSEEEYSRERMGEFITNYVLEKSKNWNIPEYVENGSINNTKLLSRVIRDILDLGPLEKPMRDNNIVEIRVDGRWIITVDNNNKSRFLKDENGKKVHFSSPEEQETIMNHRLIVDDKAVVNNEFKLVNARTLEGYRVSFADTSVISTDQKNPDENGYASFTIRKFRDKSYTLKELVKMKTLSDDMAKLCKYLIYNTSLAVVGPVFAGKTTLLKSLNTYIPDMTRVICIQQPTEQELRRYNANGELMNDRVMYEADEGAMGIDKDGNLIKYSNTLNNLIAHTLRNSPNIVSLNEIRHPEEFESCILVGQVGNLINLTFHAETAEEACNIATNKLIAKTGQNFAIGLKDITDVFHFIICQNILGDGSRAITEISEICGVDPTDRYKPKINTLYKINITDVKRKDNGQIDEIIWEHKKVGNLSPEIREKFRLKGMTEDYIETIDPKIENYKCSYDGKEV